jgi:hypothetical protein
LGIGRFVERIIDKHKRSSGDHVGGLDRQNDKAEDWDLGNFDGSTTLSQSDNDEEDKNRTV